MQSTGHTSTQAVSLVPTHGSQMIYAIAFMILAAQWTRDPALTALFTPEVPWAVLPLFVYTFGLAVAMPAIQVTALGLFPDNRGLASSMLSFIQMMAFALVSGLVAPLLFDSAFKLACGVAVGLVASFVASRLAAMSANVTPAQAGA